MDAKSTKGLLLGPGLLQNRSCYCCLVCAMADYKFPIDVVKLIMNSCGLSLCKLDSRLKRGSFGFQLTDLQYRVLGSIVDSLYDMHLSIEPKIIHDGYYQARDIQIRSPHAGTFISNSVVRKGKILQVFFSSSDTEHDKNRVMDDIKTQVTCRNVNCKQYLGLSNIPFDRCVEINTRKNEIVISWPSELLTTSVSYNAMFDGAQAEDSLATTLRRLTVYDSVAMVIIDCLEAPSCGAWMHLLNFAYGDMEDVIVVFAVMIDSFDSFGATRFEQVKTLINRDMKPGWHDRILCLESDRLYARKSSSGWPTIFS